MKKNIGAFTFVELIVVLVIIAILATIGFIAYESYLSTGRDTAKVSLIRDIQTSLGTYSLRSQIPLPENKVDITASGSLFAYQGDFTEETANTIGLKGSPYDESLEIYPSYMLLLNRKDFQILHYLEDQKTLQGSISSSFAFTDYQQLNPIIKGKPLGIMIHEETYQPLHLIDVITSVGTYDIVNGNESLRSYYSQERYFEGNIKMIIPNRNCKRILELGGSNGSGVYTINPTGERDFRVFCDMDTDGGGWNVLVNNNNSDDESISSSDCKPRLSGFIEHSCGSISESSDFVVSAGDLEFNELVFSAYSGKFTNMLSYQYMKWDSTQTIPNTPTFQSDIATSWDNELITHKGKNDLRCTSYSPRYVTLHNGGGVFEPHFALQFEPFGGTEAELSIIDAGPSSNTRSTNGIDDYQDGDGCNDNWGNKSVRGSSSFIMVR